MCSDGLLTSSTRKGQQMISDKERHERAKNFRDMVSAREYGIPGKVGSFVDIDDLLSELLDRRVYDSEVAIDACEAIGIADLIDRPTCHLELTDVETHGNAKVRIYECSECGRPCEEIYGKYERCPHCGAVVVDED